MLTINDFLQFVLSAVFPPLTILSPLLVVAVFLSKNRAPDESSRKLSAKWMLWLVVFTVSSLMLWACLFFFLPAIKNRDQYISQTSFLFLPLWFGLAMQTLRARMPKQDSQRDGGAVRRASLGNRERKSPIRRWHWYLAFGALAFWFLMIALRGIFPFESPGASEAETARGQFDFQHWLTFLVLYPLIFLPILLMGPRMLRLSLLEPEPMLAEGSEELEQLYRRNRDWRTLVLFWALIIILPTMLGAVYSSMVWFPNYPTVGATLGVISGTVGGVGGTILGMMGDRQRRQAYEFRKQMASVSEIEPQKTKLLG